MKSKVESSNGLRVSGASELQFRELEHSQALLTSLIDSSADMIWSVNPIDFGLTLFNRGLYDYFLDKRGISITTGMRPEDLFPTDDFVQRWRGFYQQALQEGSYTTEYRTYSGGDTLLLNINMLKVDSEVVGLSVFGKNITAQKQMESTLRQTEKYWQSLVENTSDLVTVLDAGGHILYQNPAVEHILGYKQDELNGKNAFGLVHPEDWPHTRSIFTASVSNPQSSPPLIAFRIRHKDGLWRIMEATGEVRVNETGQSVAVLTSRDVTDRKRIEKLRMESETRFRVLIEDAPVAVGITQGGCDVYANPAFLRMFGYERSDDLQGHPFTEHIAPAYRDEIVTRARKRAHGMPAQTAYESVGLRKDGSTFPFSVVVSEIELSDGPATAVFFTDLSKNKQAAEEIRRSRERLEQAVRIAGLGIWEWDIETDKVSWDGEMFSLYGISPETFTGRGSDYIQATRADYREKQRVNIRKEIERSITEAEFMEGTKREYSLKELCIVRPDGSECYTLGDAVCVTDAEGKPKRMFGVTFDITERKQMEAALRESEARYRFIAENTADVIWTLSLKTGKFTYVSPSVQKLRGFTPEEVLTQTMADALTPESLAHVTQLLQKRTAALQADRTNVRNILSRADQPRKDGTVVPTEVLTTLILNAQGEPAELVGVSRDITERENADKRLRASEERYKLMFESAPIAINITQGTDIIYANPSYLKLFGISRLDDLKHFAPLELFTPECRPQILENIQRRAKGLSAPDGYEAECFRGDGTRFPILMYLTKTIFADGPATVGFVVDITERKRAEEALRESEALFRTVFESSIAGIGMVDADGKFIRVNSQLCEMLGYTQQELLRLTFNDITFEEDQGYSLTTLKQMVSDEIDSASFEKRYIKKNGDIIWVFISISAIRDKNHQYQYNVTYIQDITARKRNQTELESLLDKLRKTTEGTIETLAHIVEARDPYTSGHQKRVADISVAVAEYLGLSAEQIRGIYYAGLIHDLGKIQVPSEILSKPGKLTKLEYELIKIHPEVGFDLLKDVDFPWPIAEIIYQHHERMDGSGYPRKLKGDGIFIEAKIIAVADVIDAMSTHRPYRPALGLDDALAEIEKNKGTLYDAVIVESFLKVIRKDKKHAH